MVIKIATKILPLFATLLFSQVVNAQTPLTYKTMKELPAFTLETVDGEKFTSSSVVQKGKQTVVIYFSPTCNHCQTQTEDITSNMKLFKQVQFLMVTSYPPSDIKPFLDTYAIDKFPNIKVGYDPNFNMGKFYDLKSIPGVFIYGKDRMLKSHFDVNLKPEKLAGELAK